MADIADLIGRPVAPLRAATNDFRLTLESGEPVSTTNQDGKSTLYLTPYIGNRLGLYYNSKWNLYESAEVSVSLVGLTASTVYDVFAYWSGSAVVLETVAWTNLTTRATGIVRQDGVWAKSGDTTRRYIGTIIINASGGQTDDSFTKRFVWNLQNKVMRPCFTTNTNANWTYSTAAYREFNGGSGQLRFEFVCGLPSSVAALHGGRLVGSSGNNGYSGTNLDSTTGINLGWITVFGNVVNYATLTGHVRRDVTIGYHYITQTEYCSSGTISSYGNGSATTQNYGSKVDWES